jgi:hypothetical protein
MKNAIEALAIESLKALWRLVCHVTAELFLFLVPAVVNLCTVTVGIVIPLFLFNGADGPSNFELSEAQNAYAYGAWMAFTLRDYLSRK